MLQSFFLWFYCLSISDAVILVIVATSVFLLLRRCFAEKRLWLPVITVLFLAWLTVIVVATLTNRAPAEFPMEPQLIPFHSYYAVIAGENKEILRSNFMNAVLFYPAGLLTCELFPKTWKEYRKILLVALVFALLSVGIEVCQYRFSLGQAEVDDVMHNTLGTLAGATASIIHLRKRN